MDLGMRGTHMKSGNMDKVKRAAWSNGIILTLFFVAIPSFVYADLNDILSKIHPYITIQEEYDDNIFLSNRNKIDDFITTVSPGLRLSVLETNIYGMDLNFNSGFVYYAKHDEFNYFSPSGSINAWYAMNPRLTFRVRDYLIRSDAARESAYTAGALPDQFLLSTVRGEQAIYIRNVVEPSVEYQFAREGFLSVLYRNNIYDNQNPRFGNSQENTINTTLRYGFDSRNGVTLGYFVTLGNYERSPDQLAQGASVRYTYRFDPRTSIFGYYSFENQHFKSPGVDYNVHNPGLGIEYKFSPTLSGTAQVGYFWQMPEKGSETTGPSFNLGLTKTLTEKTNYSLAIQGGYTEDYFTAQNLGFAKYYRAYGTINHRLTEKMSVGCTGSLERETLSSGQKDWIWGIWGNASYQVFRWLALSLVVSHREDHSNIDISNYSEYRGILRLTATY
jgi:hypothetical protein